MPPVRPKTIAINVTNGVKGQPIHIYNRTSGDELNETLGQTAKHTVDLTNLTNGYTAGDIIDIYVSGEKVGGNSLTTSGTKGESITISTTSVPAIARGI